jgi:hypothetical protein
MVVVVVVRPVPRSENCGKRRLATSCLSVRLSVHLSIWNNSFPTKRILIKLEIRFFFSNLLTELKFRQNLARITSNLYEDVFKSMTISR